MPFYESVWENILVPGRPHVII